MDKVTLKLTPDDVRLMAQFCVVNNLSVGIRKDFKSKWIDPVTKQTGRLCDVTLHLRDKQSAFDVGCKWVAYRQNKPEPGAAGEWIVVDMISKLDNDGYASWPTL